jgi:hypothetical protein
MTDVKIAYECADHFEALVFSAALQLLERFELPTPRDDRNMYKEHPERWPLTERSLRQASGIRGKGFDGLTHVPREYLKYGHGAKGPEEILFGLQVLSWWHREIWNNRRKHAEHKTFGEHMRWYLTAGRHGRSLSEESAPCAEEAVRCRGEEGCNLCDCGVTTVAARLACAHQISVPINPM